MSKENHKFGFQRLLVSFRPEPSHDPEDGCTTKDQACLLVRSANLKQGAVYACNVCGLGFFKQQALGGHMNKHKQSESSKIFLLLIFQWLIGRTKEFSLKVAVNEDFVIVSQAELRRVVGWECRFLTGGVYGHGVVISNVHLVPCFRCFLIRRATYGSQAGSPGANFKPQVRLRLRHMCKLHSG